MAKMFGKLKWHRGCFYGCCRPGDIPKDHSKAKEEERWRAESEEEMYEERDEKHARGICFDPKTKMYGCDYCYDSTDYYDGSALDGVKGVWTDLERLI